VLKSTQGFHEFNVYQRLLYIPSICDKKILSPIGEGAMLSYSFDLVSVMDSVGLKFYTISFKGLFPGEPLLRGTMNIRSSDWAVTCIRYELPKESMKFFSDLQVDVQYAIDLSGFAQPQQMRIEYLIEDGLSRYHGTIDRSCNSWATDSDEFAYTDQIRNYDVHAFDRDSSFWVEHRSEGFDAIEQSYIKACDSLQTLYASDEYYSEIDSAYNALRWIDFFLYGIGYRNRERDYSFYINPLTMQVNPFGIGGYRHRIGASFKKEFENAYTLEVEGEADYGFRNSDL
jgi:hypothetical protein